MNLVYLSTLLLILQDQVLGRSTLAGVKSYEVVYPRKVHAQYRRDTGGIYPEVTQYELTIGGKKMLMHLERTEDLTADNYSETFYLPNGDAETSIVPNKDHCYYHGHIKNEDDSLVSISTCDGLSGYIKIGDQVYLIEPLQYTDSEEHAVYKHEDLERVPKTCAVPDSESSAQIKIESFLPENTDGLFATMNYIEFYVVIDHSMYKKYNYSQQALKKRIFQIINHANLLYKPMNISLVLVGSEIWTTKDLITLNPTITVTLESFALWTVNDLRKRKNFDDAFLFTDLDFDGPAVGVAYIGAMCTQYASNGVVQDASEDATEVGLILAHEMGHNLGMNHDTASCSCKSGPGRCIMEPSNHMDFILKEFSSCSFQYYKDFISKSGTTCTRNKPSNSAIATTSGCGNMILQVGEECDCGSPEECNDPCCNAKTCTLKEGAKCSSGECCENCQIKKAGVTCRPAKHECDLSDACDGQSAQCPADKYRLNGSPCKNNQGYCYMGKCPTLQDQCINVFGPSTDSGTDGCFRLNAQVDSKHIGYCKREGDKYLPCALKDIRCGMLFCSQRIFFSPCMYAYSSSGDSLLVTNGTKCGSEQMCINSECKSIGKEWLHCSDKCKGHAVCNNEMQCQCEEGWAPPNCDVLLFPKIET